MGHLVNWHRIREDIEAVRSFSQPCEGGVTRLSFTKEYRMAVEYIKDRAREIGLLVREDSFGNVYGLLEGREPDRPRILSGSHMDTVHCGGAFDGFAGVACALEVARTIKESGESLRSGFEIVGTVEEEGSRFGQVLMGSQFITGLFGEREMDLYRALDGVSVRQALGEYYGDSIPAYRLNRDEIKVFLELHIEQGPVLENKGLSIGIVERIVGISWLRITVHGFAGHAGTVPMDVRQDAGIAAFDLITNVNRHVTENYALDATATVGRLSLLPDSSNCIPSKCSFTVDLRAGKYAHIEEITAYIRSCAADMESKYGVQIDLQIESQKQPVQMDSQIQSVIQKSCDELGYAHMRLNSGAGHDAMIFAEQWKTGMIFVPCHRGITHNPDERAEWQDLARGTNVLYKTVLNLDNIN